MTTERKIKTGKELCVQGGEAGWGRFSTKGALLRVRSWPCVHFSKCQADRDITSGQKPVLEHGLILCSLYLPILFFFYAPKLTF